MKLRWKPLTSVSALLAIIGLAISSYLTYVHYRPEALMCGSGGCGIVQSSQFSTMFGIPIALFGVAMFVTLLVSIVLREMHTDSADMISTGIIMILVAAVLYWAYLTWLELRVIYAICQWCVATSIATVALLGVESFRWYQGYMNIGNE